MTSWKNRKELRIFSELTSERNRAEIRDENSIWMSERSEVNRKIPVKCPERSENAMWCEASWRASVVRRLALFLESSEITKDL